MSPDCGGRDTPPPSGGEVLDQIPFRTAHRKGRAYTALAVVAALMISILILITCIDVLGRYLFDRPLTAAYEMTQVVLAALIFIALPLTTADRAHVEVDLVLHLVPKRLQRGLGRIADLVASGVLLYFAWRLGVVAQALWHDGARLTAINAPLAPLAGIATASCVISAAILIARRPA